MFYNTIMEIFAETWPMILIITVIVSSMRIVYIIKNNTSFKLYNEILGLGFIIYIMCLFYAVTFQDVSWSTSNFIPFKEMFRYDIGSPLFFKNVIGNVILFIPYGFFISYFLKLDKKVVAFILTVITSLTIETTQLVIGRVFDVDDIVLNIIGGMSGYFIYRFIYNISSKLPKFLKNAIVYNIIVIVVVMVIILYLLQVIRIGG